MALSTVLVKQLSGDEEIFELDAAATVDVLRDAIFERLQRRPEQQKLVYGKNIVTNGSTSLQELFGGGERTLLLLWAAGADFRQDFALDASNPEDLAANYPHVKPSSDASKITVANGTLIKQGQGEGDLIYEYEGGSDLSRIVYKICITCDRDRYNVGLGCFVAPSKLALPPSNWREGAMQRFCFHPGMSEGEFRIEGPGGMFNQSIGFTPPRWEDSVGGTAFTIELNKSGSHKVTLTDPRDSTKTFSWEWENSGLWDGDGAPKFGIYDGDIQHRGRVYYTSFSVASELREL